MILFVSLISFAQANEIDCRSLTVQQKRHLGRTAQFDQLQDEDGWLSYVPPRLRLAALNTIFAVSKESAFRKSGLATTLNKAEKVAFAISVLESDVATYLSHIDSFGLPIEDLVQMLVQMYASSSNSEARKDLELIRRSSLSQTDKYRVASSLLVRLTYWNGGDYANKVTDEQVVDLGFLNPKHAADFISRILTRYKKEKQLVERIWQRVQFTQPQLVALLKLSISNSYLPAFLKNTDLTSQNRREVWLHLEQYPNIDPVVFAKIVEPPRGALERIAMARRTENADELLNALSLGPQFANEYLARYRHVLAYRIVRRNEGLDRLVGLGLRLNQLLVLCENQAFSVCLRIIKAYDTFSKSDVEAVYNYLVSFDDLSDMKELNQKFIDALTNSQKIEIFKRLSKALALEHVRTSNLTRAQKLEVVRGLDLDLDLNTIASGVGLVLPREFILERLINAVESNGSDESPDLRYVFSFSPEVRLDLAKRFIANPNRQFFGAHTKFKIDRAEDRLDLAIAVLSRRAGVEPYSLGVDYRLSATGIRILERVRFAENIEQTLSDFMSTKGQEQLNPVAPIEELLSIAEAYAQENPGVLQPGLVTRLWGKVKRRDVCIRTLRLYYRMHQYQVPDDLPLGPEAIWSKGLAWDLASVKLAAQTSRFANTLSLALDIEDTVRFDRFSGLKIAADAFAKPQLNKLNSVLSRLRDWYHLKGNRVLVWNSIRQIMQERGIAEIDGRNLIYVENELNQLFVRDIQILFASADLSISIEQLDQLKQEWGSLDPIFTLVSRFNGSPAWRPRMKELAEIFDASLKSQFLSFKTAGDDKAREQLSMLRPESIGEWTAIRSRLELLGSSTGESGDQNVGAIIDIVERNLSHHYTGWQTASPNEALVEFLRKNRGPPGQVLPQIKTEFYAELSEPEFLKQFERDLMAATIVNPEISKISTTVSALMTFRSSLQLSDEVLRYLQDINRFLKDFKVAANRDDIVFTTTFNHPKLLLTIGDLVQASSCQNFRTGSVIGTLPGYVMDAGVQGMLSMILSQGQFQTPQEFSLVQEAIRSGIVRSSQLNGGDKSVTFTIAQEDVELSIRTRPIDYGFRRQVIKLGRAQQGGPGLVLETAYQQNHRAQPVMERHMIELRDEIARAIYATTAGIITMPASRNGGGIYSDRGGGEKTTEYTIDAGN